MRGESLPRLFGGAALGGVESRQSDRNWPMTPPYASPFERAQAEEAIDAAEREIAVWDEVTTRRYFLAGGGTADEFHGRWSAALTHRRRVGEAIRSGIYSCAGGGLFYLVWGRR